jgi:polar amino acid transport system substrate-binding protein
MNLANQPLSAEAVMFHRMCLGLFLLLLAGTQASAAEPLTYVTEAYPPYNFSDHNILRGIAVDLLIVASQQTATPVLRSQIRLMPWARSYRDALKTPNYVLFSTTRTPEREKLFKWAGPITTNRVVLLAKKSRGMQINSLADLQHLRIGSIRDDVGEQLVRELGVQDSQLNLAANGDALAHQLQAGRIDLWAYDQNAAQWFIRNAGLEPDDFESVYTLQEGQLWYAFNPAVSDAQVAELQKALDAIRQIPGISGKSRYDDILLDYL